MPHRRSSSPLVNLPILIITLPIIALVLLFFIIPPFLTLTSQIFRPYTTVKKSWDSINIFLVLFAVFCGVFARRNDDDGVNNNNNNNEEDTHNVSGISSNMNQSPPHLQQSQWFDQFSERKVYDPPATANGGLGLRRNSSSYPDLRQETLWENGDDRFRFFDDFDIRNKYRSADNNHHHRLRRTQSDFQEPPKVKVIPVDTFVLRSSPPRKSPPPPPPPPPAAVRTYHTVGRKDKSTKRREVDIKKVNPQPPQQQQPPPPPPTPPPAVQMECRSEQKFVKLERRKSNATKEIKMALSSFYKQRKRKKKQKSTDIDESVIHSPIPPPSPAPPPPPPPPPPSVFYNLFKKSSKIKKIHSAPPPPPPPPPPRSSKRKSHVPPPQPPPAPSTPPPQFYRKRNAATTYGKPPLPTKLYDENVNSGNQSPLIPVPPPPPPFKMQGFRFVARGDFVSVNSTHNSRCNSPELEEVDLRSKKESIEKIVNATDGGDGVGSVFCPSPDVNIKADTFIARLRDGWRLEKMNSTREKQRMGSSPGPGSLAR